VEHPAVTSVTSDQAQISIQQPGRPGELGGHSQQATRRKATSATPSFPGGFSLTEGDLILGEGSRSAVGTLVERSTRLTLLLHLPGGKTAEQVEAAMRETISALPASLARTITWDQGAEMSKHAEFTTATGIPIYFCDPHSPWQRGRNSRTCCSSFAIRSASAVVAPDLVPPSISDCRTQFRRVSGSCRAVRPRAGSRPASWSGPVSA
jgi:hypothetical protein